jgi:hypothetical protein
LFCHLIFFCWDKNKLRFSFVVNDPGMDEHVLAGDEESQAKRTKLTETEK